MSVPTDTVSHPTRGRRRLPLVAGSVIVAAGLVFGGLTVADASNTPAAHTQQQHQHGYTTDPIPTKGDSIANVGVVENQIKANSPIPWQPGAEKFFKERGAKM